MKKQDNPQTETERRKQQGDRAREEYVRAKEASTIIGVAICTIWEYRRLGLISSFKLSEKVTVFKVSELRDFVESRIVEVV